MNKELKLESLDIVKFLAFLKGTDIGRKQIIEITPESCFCKAHPDDRQYVIYKSIPLPFKVKAEFTRILIPLMSYARIIAIMEFYKNVGFKELNGKIVYSEYKGMQVCSYISFTAGKTTTKVVTADMALMSYMDDTMWAMVTNLDSKIIEFSMDKITIKQIRSLSDIYKKTNKDISYKLTLGNDGISLTGKDFSDWKLEIPTENINSADLAKIEKQQIYTSSMSAAEYSEGENLKAYVKTSPKGTPLLLLIEDKDNIFMNSLVRE